MKKRSCVGGSAAVLILLCVSRTQEGEEHEVTRELKVNRDIKIGFRLA